MNIDDLRAALAQPNVAAFLRVIREGESAQTDAAYWTRWPGKTFDDLSKHPRIFEPIPGKTLKSSAAGAYQITATTWDGLVQQFGFRDFTPATQDLACVALLYRRNAVASLLRGDLEAAIAFCRGEWTSLPGAEENRRMTIARAREVFAAYGGTVAAPIVDADPAHRIIIDQKAEAAMPIPLILSILGAVGPVIGQMIPQIAQLMNPQTEVAKRNVGLAATALETIVKATGAVNEQDAVQRMQADPAALEAARRAVLSHPKILDVLEVGGGVKEARENDLRAMASDKPFWKASPVFWISILMLPMVIWYVGSTIVGGIDIPSEWPWYAQLPLKFFGTAWSADAKAGIANLVIGLVLGGICGVYYGVSVTQRNANDGKQAQ